MLTKRGCAIYVHLQLDLLKFYLAILKRFSWCRFCAVHVSAACSLQRTREVNSREELVSSWSSVFVCSFRHGGALLLLIAPVEAGLFSLPSLAKWNSLPQRQTCVFRTDWLFERSLKDYTCSGKRTVCLTSTQKLRWLHSQSRYNKTQFKKKNKLCADETKHLNKVASS